MRPYSPEAVEEAFGSPAGGPDLPENLSKAELAQALRDWQEENPGDDLAASLTGGIPYAAADLAASNELDEPLWMQLLYAAGVIPAVGPVTKGGRKLIELLQDLPEGGVRKFIEKGLTNPDRALKFFDEDGNLRSWHGSNDYIPEFTTEKLQEVMGRSDINVGPGTYSSFDTSLPFLMTGRKPTQWLHKLTTPREDIGGYMALDFPGIRNRLGFEDQTEQVKDALSRLYPRATDEQRYELFRRSKMGGDLGDGMNPFMPGLTREVQTRLANQIRSGDDLAELADFKEANKVLRDEGILGNIHVEGTPQLTHFDPDRLIPSEAYGATRGEWYRGERNLRELREDGGDPMLLIDEMMKELGMHLPKGEAVRHVTPEVWDSILKTGDTPKSSFDEVLDRLWPE